MIQHYMESEKDRRKVRNICIAVILAGYSAVMYFLFYRQCIVYDGMYGSDVLPYLDTLKGLETEYEFPYPLMFLLSRAVGLFTTTENALAIVLTALNSLSLLLVYLYFRRCADGDAGADAGGRMLLLEGFWLVMPPCLMVVSMLYGSFVTEVLGYRSLSRCLGAFTPNPYWNATYLAARPFAILSFFTACRLLDRYESDAGPWDYLAFGASLLLATLTKPSYSLVAITTLGLILAYRFVKSRFRNLKKSILFGLSILPAGFDCLYQYSGVFTGTNAAGEETGIGLAFGKAWLTITESIPLSILLGCAFPLWMLAVNLRRLRDATWFRHAWQLWLMGLAMLLFLYEKGFRMEHVNFAWGYVYGIFFVFFVGMAMLVKNTTEQKSVFRTVLVGIGWVLFLLHLFCGLYFFKYTLGGYNFYYF